MKNSRQTFVYQELKKKILQGDYQPGDFLPSLRVLANEFSSSVTPVYKATQQLAEGGYIELLHGSGMRVRANSPEEIQAARKPIVQFLGIASAYHEKPGEVHSLPATSDWLLWELTHCPSITVAAAHFQVREQEVFLSRLKEAYFSDAQVVVFAYPEQPDPSAMEWIRKIITAGKAVVYLGNRISIPGCDMVRGDYREGTRQLTRYLLERGHRHILRFHDSFANWYEQQKQQGYEVALTEHNETAAKPSHGLLRQAPAAGGEVLTHDEETERNISLIEDALQQAPLTAIMAANDIAVIMLRIALSRMGREDIELVGYDASWPELGFIKHYIDKHEAEVHYEKPPVSVDSGFRQVGLELATLAIARATGKLPNKPQSVLVPHRLVVPPHATTA